MQRSILATIIFGLFCSFPLSALAYAVPTHAYLTGEILDFYNRNFPNKKVEERFRSFLIEGSRKEDEVPRWLNHFYDPVHERGLTTSAGSWSTSKAWARDEEAQNSVKYKAPTAIASVLTALQARKVSELSTETNFAWQRAIRFYARGEEEKAFLILGHILHLIEDAGVPDHTRNDPHPTGSPYEEWTSQFALGHVDPELKNRLEGKYPASGADLDEYFNKLATYSNNNFYSKDTIGVQSGYSFPQPDYVSKNGDYFYGVRSEDEGQEYKLFIEVKKGFLRSDTVVRARGDISILLNKKDGDLVIRDYWKLLSPKAVQYGAGVISLFFKEAEKAKQDPGFKKEEPPGFVGQVILVAKESFAIISGAVRDLYGRAKDIPIETKEGEKPALLSSDGEDQYVAEITEEVSSSTTELGKPAPSIEDAPYVGTVLGEETVNIQEESEEGPSIAVEPTSGGGAPVFIKTFGGEVVVPVGETSTGGATTPQMPPEEPQVEKITPVSHVVISEVLFDAEGSDAGKEFVELYNPTDAAVDLSEWILERGTSDSTSTESLVKIGSKLADKTIISPKGFFLFGFGNFDGTNWRGVVPDIVRSASLPNGPEDYSIIINLKNAEGEEVDLISYDKRSINIPGESSERRAVYGGACEGAVDSGEFLGNACDRGFTDDLSARTFPFPQGSGSLFEPRIAPQIHDLEVAYDPNVLSIKVSWGVSEDARGATSTVSYVLRDISSSSIEIFRTTSTQKFSYRIQELNRTYRISLSAGDSDGMASLKEAEIFVPSLLDAAFLYHRSTAPENEYVIDLRYQERPFIPKIFLPEETLYQGLVFYLNRDPNTENSLLKGVNQPLPQYMDGILSVAEKGGPAAVFGLRPDRCVWFGQGIGANCWYLEEEDPRVIIRAGVTPGEPLSASDYFTIAYYDFPPGRDAGLGLVAYEKTKRYFSDSIPPELSPLSPSALNASWNKFESTIHATWGTSTDPDTPDRDIVYESAVSTNGDFENAEWRDHGAVQGGLGTSASYVVSSAGKHFLGVRAKDVAGSVSLPAIVEVTVPEPFHEYTKTPFLENGSQDFSIREGGGLSEIQIFNAGSDLRVPNPSGVECRLEIYEISDAGQTLVASADDSRRGSDCGAYPIFTFSSHPNLETGKAYRWMFSLNAGEYAKVKFYGKAVDTAGGVFSNGSIANSSFIIRGVSGLLLNNE
ncbi:MAG: lamin tail domain-containing protein [Patescibacteria group bacterium]